MKNNIFIKAFFAVLAVASLIGCSLDERDDDLVGGYEGAFIDKLTGDTVATEYYGARLMLLDLNYGDIATPLNYKALPDGSFKNTKVFPAKYKVYGVGPFFQLDTMNMDIKKSGVKINMMVTPNVTVSIKDVKILYGIAVQITLTYQVNDETSTKNDLGFVYSKNKYPGQRNAMNETEAGASTYKRIRSGITEKSGELTETFYLEPNTTYYFRALARSEKGGDYWNYSKQIIVSTSGVDLSSLPIEAAQGVTSATSAVLQWAFPPIVDSIKLSYTDRDGLRVVDTFSPSEFAYVANLPHDTESSITTQLSYQGTVGPEQTIKVKTKGLDDKYVPSQNVRPSNVPFYDDVAFERSFSADYALIEGPRVGEDWSSNSSRYRFMEWWNGWSWAAYRQPSCQDVENFTTLNLQGNLKNMVDIIAFVNLETLNIKVGELFDVGLSADPNINLRVLKKLKKLKTINIGPGVSLTKSDFEKAGVTGVTIVKE